jgi:Zn-dependent protease with chaperone function
MSDMSSAREQSCPLCGSKVPVHDGYVTWCECGWNLKPQRPDRPDRLWGRVYARASRNASERLLRQAIGAERLGPAVTVSIALAFVLAALVYLFAVVCVLLGLFVLTQVPRMPPLLLPAALLLLGLAWLCRPRLGKTPEELLDRERYSALYKLADRIADELDTRAEHGISVTTAWNASFIMAGLKRRRFVAIGLPLWAALDDRERVALLAHEIAHGANADPTRTLVVGSAIAALFEINAVLRPSWITEEGWGWMNLATLPLHLIFLGLANLEWAYALLLAHLLWQEQRRAEFLADWLAAGVAGSEATIGVHEKLALDSTFWRAVQTASLRRTQDTAFGLFRDGLAAMPERERERMRRVAEMTESRLDSTHPPTAHRIRFLREREPRLGSLRDGPALAAAANDALAASEGKVHSDLVGEYRDRLFS